MFLAKHGSSVGVAGFFSILFVGVWLATGFGPNVPPHSSLFSWASEQYTIFVVWASILWVAVLWWLEDWTLT